MWSRGVGGIGGSAAHKAGWREHAMIIHPLLKRACPTLESGASCHRLAPRAIGFLHCNIPLDSAWRMALEAVRQSAIAAPAAIG
jgi:hypothetical protein